VGVVLYEICKRVSAFCDREDTEDIPDMVDDPSMTKGKNIVQAQTIVIGVPATTTTEYALLP